MQLLRNNLFAKNSLIYLAFLFAIAFWFIDSWIDSAYFSHEIYSQSLQPVGMELYMRLLVSFQIIIFGYFGSLLVQSNARLSQRIEDDLKDEHKNTIDTLRINEERLRLALISSKQAWFDLNASTGEVLVSPEYFTMLGYAPTTLLTNLQKWLESVHPLDKNAVYATFQKYLSSAEPESIEYRLRNCEGDWIWIRSIGKVTEWDQVHQPLRVIGIHTNITERKLAESALQLQKDYLKAIFDTEPECVKVISAEGVLTDINHAGLDMLEVKSIEEVQKIGLAHFIDAGYQSAFNELHQRVLGGSSGVLKFPIKGAKGTARWVETYATPLKNGDGTVISLLGVTRDITEQRAHETELLNTAQHDSLTELPNRALLTDRLLQAIAQARRDNGSMALLFLDLDKFKPINDTFGHGVGDLLLQEVARRLQHCVKRETDTVSRLGGDEFVILLPQILSEQDATSVANQVIHSLNIPFEIEQHILNISSSIGVAIYPTHGDTAQKLMKNADDALYVAKESGRGCFKLYGDHSDASTDEKLLREKATDLISEKLTRQNLVRSDDSIQNELEVHQIELKIQAEELIRINHNLEKARERYLDLFDFAPAAYMSLAEDGNIVEANLAATRLLELAHSKLIDTPFTRYLTSKDSDRWYLHSQELQKNSGIKSIHLSFTNAHGETFNANVQSTLLNVEGKPSVTQVIISEILDGKSADVG